MPDRPNSPRDLSALYNERRKVRDVEIAAYNEVEAAIRGETPEVYERLFTESDVRLNVGTIRSADDSMTTFLSEIPILPHVPVLGKRETDTQRNKSELVEKIIGGYHNARGDFSLISHPLARFNVRFQDAIVVVHADLDDRYVWLEVKDPRCHYPPNGWTPWSPYPLDGTLLVFDMTLGEVKRRYAYDSYGMAKSDVLSRLNNAYAPTYGYGGFSTADDSQIVQIGFYRSRGAWYQAALSDTDVVLEESQDTDPTHPGVTGVASFKAFATDPLFLGQIGIEAGAIKVLNQQIQNTERINKATTYGPPLLNDEKVVGGYNEINYALLQGRSAQFYREAPDNPGNLNQVLGLLLSMADKYNYNPESLMGQGDANSGKALQQLQAGPRSRVTNLMFAPYKRAWPVIYDDCMDIELKLWPNERKKIRGSKHAFDVEYTPSSALQGYRSKIRIEDARPGGYNAFLEALQKKDAGMASLRDILEADPDTKNVEETLRRIEAQDASNFLKAAFEGMGAADPLMGMKLSADLLTRINSGKSRDEAITDMLAEGVLEPPAPEAPPGMPEMPPELAGLMSGAGGAPEAPLPSLAEARGYA